MRQARSCQKDPLPSRLRLPARALVGVCGVFALAGPIMAADSPGIPAAPAGPIKFHTTPPQETYDVNGFVFEGGSFNPNYQAPPQPRGMPTANTIQPAAPVQPQPERVVNVPAPTHVTAPAPRNEEPAESTTATKAPRARLHPPAERETPPPPANKPEHPRFRYREPREPRETPEATHPAPREEHHEEHNVPPPSEGGKEGKEGKPVITPVEESTFAVTGSAGYYSKYMFRGLDVGYRTGIDSGNDSAFFSTQAATSYKGFALGFGFTESLDPYVQRGSAFNNDFGNRTDPTGFRSAPKERYKEYDLFANYTYNITSTLSLTGGMNFYWFGDGRSWANQGDDVSNTMETALSLNYTGIPFVNQSLNYYYDFDAFTGSYLEYKIAAKPITIFHEGSFAISLIPSATVSYDFRYNGTNNGWNGFEPGLDIPIQIADGLVVSLGARYNMDLGSSSGNGKGGFVDRTDDRAWFSAAVQYSFPNGGWAEAKTLPSYGKDKNVIDKDKVDLAEENHPWSIQLGAGVRSISSDFHLRQTGLNALASRLAAGGSTDFARPGVDTKYLDGSVYSGTDNFGDGTAAFSFKRQSQISSPSPSEDRLVAYHSERFNSDDTKAVSSNHNDDDESVYPYINFSRELLRKDKFSLSMGVGYQFARSETDSGYRVSGIAKNTEYTFTYDFDELFSNSSDPKAPFNNHRVAGTTNANDYYVVFDAKKYSQVYGGIFDFFLLPEYVPRGNPSAYQQNTRDIVAYKRATLDTNLHSFSIPIDLKVDLTKRIHLGVSFGPTFNLFDTDMKTDTYIQLVDLNTADPKLVSQTSPFDKTTGKPVTVAGIGGGAGLAGRAGAALAPTASARAGVAAAAAQPTAGGGKGAPGAVSRDLPGNNLSHTVSHHSGQQFQMGVFGQLSLDIDLDAAKRWYVEVYTRYDYVPEFSIADGTSSSVVDASSLGGGLGIGYRF